MRRLAVLPGLGADAAGHSPEEGSPPGLGMTTLQEGIGTECGCLGPAQLPGAPAVGPA